MCLAEGRVEIKCEAALRVHFSGPTDAERLNHDEKAFVLPGHKAVCTVLVLCNNTPQMCWLCRAPAAMLSRSSESESRCWSVRGGRERP